MDIFSTEQSAVPTGRFSWFEPVGESRGDVAVVFHGLNQRPDRMGRVVEALTDLGYAALLVTLTGHDGDEEAFRGVLRSSWHDDVDAAFREARERSDPDGQVVLVGYSLGALAALDYLSSLSDVSGNGNGKAKEAGRGAADGPESGRRLPFDRAVLFAPALSLRSFAHWARFPGRFMPDFFVPSFAPADSRSCRGTPGAAYRALFHMHDSLRRSGIPGGEVPVLCFIDPKDEMVSAKGLRRLILRSGLAGWRISEVFARRSDWGRPIHHLIIDPELVGEEPWRGIVAEMARFLSNGRGSSGSSAA